MRRENDVGEATAAAIEDDVFDFADVLAARILDFRTDDAATLDVARARGRAGAGLSKQRSRGETQQRQSCSQQDIFFHKL
jgi:hypothetical protein